MSKDFIKEWLPVFVYIISAAIAVGYYRSEVQSNKDKIESLERRYEADKQSMGRKIDNIYNILINKK